MSWPAVRSRALPAQLHMGLCQSKPGTVEEPVVAKPAAREAAALSTPAPKVVSSSTPPTPAPAKPAPAAASAQAASVQAAREERHSNGSRWAEHRRRSTVG